jgi:hypothetical protein
VVGALDQKPATVAYSGRVAVACTVARSITAAATDPDANINRKLSMGSNKTLLLVQDHLRGDGPAERMARPGGRMRARSLWKTGPELVKAGHRSVRQARA